MEDWLIVLLCFIYITIEVFCSFIAHKFFGLKSEYTRKVIHILTSFVIVPVEYYVTSPLWRLTCPIIFVFINIFAVFSGLVKDLGMTDEERHLGLILYPISVTGIVLLEVLNVISPSSAICGILIMGLGDGMAALIGTMFGKHSYTLYGKYKKSIEGSVAMAVATTIVVLYFSDIELALALLAGLFMALIENISPSSVDNVSVPFLGALVVEVLCKI